MGCELHCLSKLNRKHTIYIFSYYKTDGIVGIVENVTAALWHIQILRNIGSRVIEISQKNRIDYDTILYNSDHIG